MVIKKVKEYWTIEDIWTCVVEATTIEELEFIYENVKKSSISEKNKNSLLTMIPFKMASIGFKPKVVNK